MRDSIDRQQYVLLFADMKFEGSASEEETKRGKDAEDSNSEGEQQQKEIDAAKSRDLTSGASSSHRLQPAARIEAIIPGGSQCGGGTG